MFGRSGRTGFMRPFNLAQSGTCPSCAARSTLKCNARGGGDPHLSAQDFANRPDGAIVPVLKSGGCQAGAREGLGAARPRRLQGRWRRSGCRRWRTGWRRAGAPIRPPIASGRKACQWRANGGPGAAARPSTGVFRQTASSSSEATTPTAFIRSRIQWYFRDLCRDRPGMDAIGDRIAEGQSRTRIVCEMGVSREPAVGRADGQAAGNCCRTQHKCCAAVIAVLNVAQALNYLLH